MTRFLLPGNGTYHSPDQKLPDAETLVQKVMKRKLSEKPQDTEGIDEMVGGCT